MSEQQISLTEYYADIAADGNAHRLLACFPRISFASGVVLAWRGHYSRQAGRSDENPNNLQNEVTTSIGIHKAFSTMLHILCICFIFSAYQKSIASPGANGFFSLLQNLQASHSASIWPKKFGFCWTAQVRNVRNSIKPLVEEGDWPGWPTRQDAAGEAIGFDTLWCLALTLRWFSQATGRGFWWNSATRALWSSSRIVLLCRHTACVSSYTDPFRGSKIKDLQCVCCVSFTLPLPQETVCACLRAPSRVLSWGMLQKRVNQNRKQEGKQKKEWLA